MPRFKEMPMHPSQALLFSQSVAEALPTESDVRPFNEVMECVSYCGIETKCAEVAALPRAEEAARTLGIHLPSKVNPTKVTMVIGQRQSPDPRTGVAGYLAFTDFHTKPGVYDYTVGLVRQSM